MKRLASWCSVAVTLFLGACGGGGGSFTPPPPNPGSFSAASLKGQYAFTTNGEVFANGAITTSQLTRVGVFIADGQGNITGGIEDANALGAGLATATITGGTYSVSSDGHGTLHLNVSGATLQFSIVMTSVNDGFMVDLTFNGNQASTGSGNFIKQDPAAFSRAGFAGSYVFDFTGQYPDNTFNPTSVIGQLNSNSNGVLSGIEDFDEAGSISSEVSIGGTYGDDSLNATLSTFGRGIAQITDGGANPQFVFYIVDSTRVRFLGTSATGILSGDAVAQKNVPTNLSAFNSGFVFALGGADLVRGPVSRLGRVTLTGSTVNNVTVDNNDAGSVVKTNTTNSASVTIDPSGTGRGTLTLKDPNQAVPYQFVFYLSSPTSGVIQDVTGTGIVADGSLSAQSGGPFSGTNITGAYAFNWSGQSIQGNTTDEEDIIGQGTIASAALSGVADINEFSGGQILGAAASGTFTFAGDGTGGDGSGTSGARNKLAFKLSASGATNINFVPYIVSPNLVFFASSDSNRVVLGNLTSQP
jgi:hypothetical protein